MSSTIDHVRRGFSKTITTRCFGNLFFINKESRDKFITTVRYDSSGENIVAGSVNGLVIVYESKTLNKEVTLPFDSSQDPNDFVPVSSIATFPLRRASFGRLCISTYTNGLLRLWDIEKQKATVALDEARLLLGVKIHSRMPYFATYGGDSNIFIYNEETMSVKQTHSASPYATKKDGHIGSICTLVFHPQNQHEFLTAGWDNSVHFWDLRRVNSLRAIKDVNITGGGLDFAPNGKEILMCAYQTQNCLQKWDYSTGKLLQSYEVDLFNSKLNCGRWFEDDYIATGGSDPTVFRIVSLQRKRTVGYFRCQQTGIPDFDTFPDENALNEVNVDTQENNRESQVNSREDKIKYLKTTYNGSSKMDFPTGGTYKKAYKMVYCVNRHLIETNAFLPSDDV